MATYRRWATRCVLSVVAAAGLAAAPVAAQQQSGGEAAGSGTRAPGGVRGEGARGFNGRGIGGQRSPGASGFQGQVRGGFGERGLGGRGALGAGGFRDRGLGGERSFGTRGFRDRDFGGQRSQGGRGFRDRGFGGQRSPVSSGFGSQPARGFDDMGLGGVRSQGPRGIGRVPSMVGQTPPRERPPLPDVGPIDERTGGAVILLQERADDDRFITGPAGFVRGPGGFIYRRDRDGYYRRERPERFDDRFRFGFDERGFRAAHQVRNDDFFLRVHLGSPGDFVQHGKRLIYPYPYTYLAPGPYVNRWPYGHRYNSWPVYTVGSGYADPAISYGPDGYYYDPDGMVQPMEGAPVRELTVVEQADLLLGTNRPEAAAMLYQEHLAQHPDDAVAMRALAVALLKAGRPQEAVAVAAMAYDKDPSGLAIRPIPTVLFSDPDDLRAALNRAVTYANRVNTASAWLLVATLMQAEGRDPVAARMLDRAIDLGLSERVASAMAAELSG